MKTSTTNQRNTDNPYKIGGKIFSQMPNISRKTIYEKLLLL